MTDADSPADTLPLSGFLQFLFNGLEGYAYAPTLDRETDTFRPTFVKVPENLSRLERHIRESSEETDVYLSPSVFSEPRATKANFTGSNVVWAEFDGNYAPGTGTVDPSVAIQSSRPGHIHCYWKLDEPVTDAVILENINRAIAYSMGADKSGWDCNQILRPPETQNHKRDLPVTYAGGSLLVHNIGDFAGYKAPDKIEADAINLKAVPDVMDVIYEYALGVKFKDVFSTVPTEGDRSTYYMRVGYYAAEAGCSNEEIYSLLYNYDDRVGKYKKREDRTRRLIDIIERVRLKYPLSGTEEESDSDALEIYDLVSFNNQVLEVDWLIPDLLQQNGNMLLVGPPGVGKTQVALNFALGLATGSEVLNYDIATPRRILFVSCEMGPVDLKVFTEQMIEPYEDKKQLLSENFFVLATGEPLYLNTVTGQDKLMRAADVLGIDGFIFDSLGSATSKSLTDEEATKGLLDFNDRLRNNMEVFSWFIHHSRKATENNKEPSGLADVYGSQYITARATTVLSLWPATANVLKVRELKKRLAPQEPDWFIQRHRGLHFKRIAKDDIPPNTYIASPSKIGQALDNDKSKRNNNPYDI